MSRNSGSASVKIREFRKGDEIEIDRIWRAHHADDFSVPNRKNSITEWVAEEDGKVVGYGQLKLFAEAMLVLDKDASQRAKVLALRELLLEGFRGANLAGIEDMYCFIRDPAFATLLSKHFGFEIVDNPGELLLRRV